MDARPPLRSALVVAFAVHAVALAWLAYVRPPVRQADRSFEGPSALEIPLDLELAPQSPSSPDRMTEPVATEPVRVSPALGAREAAARVAAFGGATAASRTDTADVYAAPDVSTAPQDAGPGFSPMQPGMAPDHEATSGALADATRAGVRAMLAEEEKKRATRAPVFPKFSPREIELGLAPGGHWVTLARDQVRRSLVPDVSKALLEFTTDGAGIVASVRVLDVSSGRSEWNEVATDLLASARERPVKVPAGANGLTITIEVSSSLKTVSGATPSASPIAKVWGALSNPLDTLVDSKAAAQRIVAAHVVGVNAL